ncbi:hypothetical protein HC028_00555 [Planosporangium flavigriseum]|uniref:Uncharacterized protein n=1 Tax=Planosporangium flavigriseum TaxID=373681 RepID=A0A8J3LLV3_9ACTN|nr:hypothetical protein [Planosporangium flavigriseum]NJC63014.1 hypothetical protein [Planosporangium flavigriseum]GIG73115.1 hypothetical protein Pfl04_15190 [Planosporangium flavigriseum]
MRVVHLLTGPLALGTALATATTAGMAMVADPAAASAGTGPVRNLVIRPHHPDVSVPVTVRRSGEAIVDLRVAAPGTDWALPGAESAVVSVSVDGRYVTDLVVAGATPLDRQFALGGLRAGVHLLSLGFAHERSPATNVSVVVDRMSVSTYSPDDPEYRVLRHAPVVYGRTIAALGGPYQNATTDTPLLAWHETVPTPTTGHVIVTYSVVWSNEDGGTNTPALMARWGRTTDIEWVYSVELDERGDRVAGSDIFQAPNHQVLHFAGRYEDDHPLLQTCTANNNMCDAVDGPMRFFLSALPTRPADQAREHLMDSNPWTYQIMAKEMLRERKIEVPSPTTAFTPAVSDQRNYLYAVVKKTTLGANSGSAWVGVSLGVRLVGSETVYLSNHTEPTWSLQRDDPAATTVELPAGTTVADIAEVSVHRVVVNTDSGAPIHVTAIRRGFFLGEDYRPQPSFLTWSGEVVLDAGTPSAVLWRR